MTGESFLFFLCVTVVVVNRVECVGGKQCTGELVNQETLSGAAGPHICGTVTGDTASDCSQLEQLSTEVSMEVKICILQMKVDRVSIIQNSG